MKIRTRTMRLVASAMAVALLTTACASDDGDEDTGDDTAAEDTADDGSDEEMEDDSGSEDEEMDDSGEAVSGEVVAAGSSTVLPVAEFVLEEYRAAQPDVDASYTSIGSGGGFERLCVETDVDLSGASRAIDDDEVASCEENGVDFIELQFAVDALTMVTSPDTDYVECLSTDQIVQIFGPDRAQTWDEVVDGAPAEEIDIFAPDTDSGTYGFMVEDVMGLEESTQDYSASADDNVIVQGIQSGAGTWGFFGLAYFTNNSEGLKAIAHENSESGECVQPSVETAEDGSYELVRPLFIYVDTAALCEKPEVENFVDFFLETATAGSEFVGYIPSPNALDESQSEVEDALASC